VLGAFAHYERALDLYFDRQFADAADIFESLAAEGDAPARVLAARAASYQRTPPPDDWDGVYQMESK
jgi:adenylate cyclase